MMMVMVVMVMMMTMMLLLQLLLLLLTGCYKRGWTSGSPARTGRWRKQGRQASHLVFEVGVSAAEDEPLDCLHTGLAHRHVQCRVALLSHTQVVQYSTGRYR